MEIKLKGMPEIDLTDRFHSLYANGLSEPMLLVGKYGGKEATLYHADMDWTPLKVTADQMFPDALLRKEEHMWMICCWTSILYEDYDIIAKRYGQQQNKSLWL